MPAPLRASLLLFLLALTPAGATAQPVAMRGYVYGGLASSWQEGATSEEVRTYLTAPGGWTMGPLVGGGVRVAHLLSVEGSLRRTGVLETIEPSRYFITYLARRRDTSIGTSARLHVPLSPGIVLEPIAGVEFVHEQSWLGATTTSPAGDQTTAPAPFVNSWGFGLAGGLDLRAGSGRHAFVPGLRVHRTDRGGDAVSTWPGGRSNWGVSVTVAWRFEFGRSRTSAP